MDKHPHLTVSSVPNALTHNVIKPDPLPEEEDGSFGGKRVCSENNDIWININNEYYLCHKLLYKMLDLATNPTINVETLELETVNKCNLNQTHVQTKM